MRRGLQRLAGRIERLTWGKWTNRVALDEVGRPRSFSTERVDGRHPCEADDLRLVKHLQQEEDFKQ